HPLVPAVGDPVETQREAVPERGCVAGVEAVGDRTDLARRTALDAFGRDGGGRIDTQPATAGKPDFGPGVRIRLADDPVVVERVSFTALVAGHDAGRYVERTHQHDECRREVLAEAGARIEQELVDRRPRSEEDTSELQSR